MTLIPTLNPLNHQKNTPKIKKTTQPKGWGEEESGSEREIGEKECGWAQEMEKKRCREG